MAYLNNKNYEIDIVLKLAKVFAEDDEKVVLNFSEKNYRIGNQIILSKIEFIELINQYDDEKRKHTLFRLY